MIRYSIYWFVTLLTIFSATAQVTKNSVLPEAKAEYVISLSGQWKFRFDPQNEGIEKEWYLIAPFDDTILLPGTTDEQGKGDPESPQIGRFTRIHAYRGAAWYQTEVEIPNYFKGKRLVFSMERTKVTKVWFDGKPVGENNSLITTQQFELTSSAIPGRHTVTVRVHNGKEENPPIGGNHQVNDGTQTNWNGILGQIQIEATDHIWLEQINVYPDIDLKQARVEINLGNCNQIPYSGKIILSAESWNSPETHTVQPVQVPVKSSDTTNKYEIVLPMGEEMQLWSEFNPSIYRLKVTLEGKKGKRRFADRKETDFGMRKFHTIGTNFAINGQRTFLRGKHDGAVFPHTGYPPMDVGEWIRILTIIKSYGINHIRCHTWCPPQAAFKACDILGMYLLPELPHWGGVGRRPEVVEGDVEQKTDVYDNTTEYLIKEGFRLFDEFGNHASFVMFEIGNELGGNRYEIANIIDRFREYDPRHLFTGGANCFLWEPKQMPGEDFWTTTLTGGSYGSGVYKNTRSKEVRSSYPSHKEGHINNILKGTDYDYSSGIEHVTVPVISHENGQFQVYPNYKEIEKYTGVTRACNFEIYRERLAKAGMLDLADDFFRASGALAVICYREDIESSIRTRGFGGFQVLDLQDFPGQGTALVGILDSYLDSKGLITSEKWREFCNDVVPLLRHDSFTWTTGQTFVTKAQIANYGNTDINKSIQWTMKDAEGKQIAGEILPQINIAQGGITDICTISVNLSSVQAPCKLEMTLSIPGTEYKNTYPLWVYPADLKPAPVSSVKVFTSLNEEAKTALEKGDKVLLLPTKEVLPTSIDGAFQTDFWCYSMFSKYDPPGTLGILCDPEHPALAHFPTEFHSNWQWWRLLKYGRPINISALPTDYRPIIQVIDNVTLNRKLGVLLEAKVGKGSLLICSMDLQRQQDYPEGRQMYHSLLKYMESKEFKPDKVFRIEDIQAIVTGKED